jgi:hypothetical protein
LPRCSRQSQDLGLILQCDFREHHLRADADNSAPRTTETTTLALMEAQMEMHQSDQQSRGWRSAVVGLIVAAVLAAPLVAVATLANPPPADSMLDHGPTAFEGNSAAYPVMNSGIAHGYLEFPGGDF